MKRFTYFAIALMFAASPAAFAESIQVQNTTSVGVGAESESHGDSMSGSAAMQVGLKASTSMSDEENEYENSSTSAEDESENSASISVSARELGGMDDNAKVEFLQSVKTFAELHSSQDLENFAKGVLLKDENVDSADVSGADVSVTYKVPAKLFGIFSSSLPVGVSVSSDASAEASSRVKVRFPWYRFFYKVPENVSASTIETAVSSNTSINAAVSAENAASASSSASLALQSELAAKARILEALSNILKAQSDTSASISANLK